MSVTYPPKSNRDLQAKNAIQKRLSNPKAAIKGLKKWLAHKKEKMAKFMEMSDEEKRKEMRSNGFPNDYNIEDYIKFQFTDEIASLGKTIANPMTTDVMSFMDKTTLYRGLGLPAGAIKEYELHAKIHDFFYFSGFTSTSLSKEVALMFTFQAIQRNPKMVPVLFVIEMPYDGGKGKTYLHDDKHSVFPEEEEYLIAGRGFRVKSIEKRQETYKGYEM